MVDKPILITGAARSGTSMTAGVIHLSGAWGGELSGPTPNNKRGMYENSVIRERHVKHYLRKHGWDPKCQNPLPPLEDDAIFHQMEIDGLEWWGRRIRRTIAEQGYDSNSPWFYKGAKMCLMWPLWHQAFPNATWLIVRRKPEDIVNSCMKTGFMSAYNKPEGWRRWVTAHEIRFAEMHEANLSILEIWPEKMVMGNFNEIRHAVESLGLEYNEEKVREFISPALWKGGRNGSSNSR